MNLRKPLNSSDLLRGVAWTPALIVSLLAILLGSAILLRDGAPLVTALLTAAPDPDRPDALSEVALQHHEAASLAKARFDKRSFFHDPPIPVKPPPPYRPPPPPPPQEDLPDPGPPPPPLKYGGPKPYGILGDMVFFTNKGTIKLGEERDGIKVLAIKAPWSVKLGWERGEYEESVWEFSEKFLQNALSDQDGDAKGLLKADGSNETLNALAGSTPANLPALASRPMGGAADVPAGRAGRAVPQPSPPSEEELAAAMEKARQQEAGDEQAESAPAPGQAPSHRAPYSASEIAALDRMGASKALQEAGKAKNDPNLDPETKKLYQQEYDQLLAHLRSLNTGGGGSR